MNPIQRIVHPHLRGLEPYTPGFQPSGDGWIKLNTNEFPFPPPDAVRQAILGEIPLLARYPDPPAARLREAVARLHGLDGEQVIIGNGSDDILNLLVRAFGGRDRETVETFPSYSLYPVINAIAGGTIHSVPFTGEFQLPVDELAGTNADLLFLTCPNAPTGIRFPFDKVKRLADSIGGILVIDEAYAEFAEATAVPLLAGHGNMVVTRTFSKAYGLAGLRVGYALASAEIISVLDRIRDSYNVNRLSQAGALAALECGDYYARRVNDVKITRDRVRKNLEEAGWQVHPSEANFLFAAPVTSGGKRGPDIAAGLFDWLKQRKILVRYFAKHPLTASHLRISIGTESEMDRFLEAVSKWTRNDR